MQSVVCADGEAYLLPCTSGTRCVSHASFAGGVCYPDTSLKSCGCDKGDYVLPDPYNPAAFLLCQSKDSDPEVIICSDGYDFDPDSKICVAAPTFPACVATGSFALQNACRWFYTCVPNGSSGWQQVHGICPGQQQMYSQVLGRCVDPDALPHEDPCSKSDKVIIRYTCSFWQLLYLIFFPHKIASICYF
nr:uncharacterized protein LOC123765579 [Procambarus clarkii]